MSNPTRRAVLEAAAAAAAVAAGDVSSEEEAEQAARLRDLAARDDADRWVYDSDRGFGDVHSPLVNADLGVGEPNVDADLRLHPSDRWGVPVEINVRFEQKSIDVGGLLHLTPEQAEAVAVDLLEQAHAARDADE